MKVTKILKATVLASILTASVSQALPFISPEIGGMVGTSFDKVKDLKINSDTTFTYGAFARLWLKPGSFRIAPFVKWENISESNFNNIVGNVIQGNYDYNRNNNLQYGVLLGLEFFYITPYVGAAYSHFTDTHLSSTWALNYGLKIKIPVIPLAVGVDASWQKPKLGDVEIDMHRVSATLSLHF